MERMRGAVVAVLCLSCGRVGFETRATDAAEDAPLPVIAVVQADASSSVTAINSLSLSAPVQAHSALIACFTFTSGNATLQTINDSLGDDYTVVAGPVVTNGFVHYIAIAPNSAGGTDTITVTLSAADSGGWDLLVLEYTGLALTAPFDTTVYDFGNSGTMTSGSASTSFGHELLLGYGHSSGMMAGPGFTARDTTSENLVEDQVVFTAGDYTATATTMPGIWTLILATFAGR
jgi:hypothetical protein